LSCAWALLAQKPTETTVARIIRKRDFMVIAFQSNG
jgi:hypothetical protein